MFYAKATRFVLPVKRHELPFTPSRHRRNIGYGLKSIPEVGKW
jgi:hypothetical protein